MSGIDDNMTGVTSANGNPYEESVTELRNKLVNLEPLLPPQCCIYRVPSSLRKVNEAAYTPSFVSIGPLHYNDENLKKMEKHKLRYLEIFLKRAEGRAKSLADLFGYVKVNEEKSRRCYAENFDLRSDEFATMILVDASFIIEHIRRFLGRSPMDQALEGHQLIFDIPLLCSTIYKKDLVLLENQLPFFVLEGLFSMIYEDVPFSHISHLFLAGFNYQGKPMPKKDFKHFTDLIRYYQLPEEEEKEQTKFDDKGNAELQCSATELREAGVRFQKSQSNVKFTDKRVLEMPGFAIDDQTEASIRNVMALEQCYYIDETSVCDYFILMDCLINTEKDVDLLVRKKILVNQLGSNQEVASLVNKLGLQIIHTPRKSRYSKTIRELNAYYEVPHHKWMATLKHVYFKTPWRGASTIAAITLLLLTLAQTFCSIFSLAR